MPPPAALRSRDSLGVEGSGLAWTFLRIVLVAVLPMFWVAAIIVGKTAPSLFLELTREDGWIEDLQVVVLLLGALIASAITWAAYRKNLTRWALIYAAITLGFIFIAGEEMSWGQRQLDVTTTDFFARYNKQKETNIHNLKLVTPVVRHGSNLVLILLIVFSVYSARISRETRLRWNAALWMPTLILLPAWLCFASYRTVRMWNSIVHIPKTLYLSRLQEPAELVLYAGLFAFAVIILSRLRHPDWIVLNR